MGPDVKLMLTFGTLHLIAVALGAGLFVMFLRSETTDPWQPPDDDDGGGGGGDDRLPGRPKSSPPFRGGPLPDAAPSSARPRRAGSAPRSASAPRGPGAPGARSAGAPRRASRRHSAAPSGTSRTASC